jgi:hypothetical protein
MSLLKLTARLRAHDWTAAIIELLIVVVGILVALQVSNWNQDRLDRARTDSYYRRIHDELLVDSQSISRVLTFWAQVSVDGRAAMAFIESGQRVDDSNWKTLLAFYQSSQMMPFEQEDTSFTEMRDAGDLSLIADEGMRKQLAAYYRLTGSGPRANLLRLDPVYRPQVRGLTPWHVQQYIWEKCFRQLVGTQQELIDCPSPISDEQAAAVLDGYRQSESLLGNLRYWMATLKVASIVLDSTRKDADKLAADIGAARAH